MRPEIPFSLKLTMAILSNDQKAANQIVAECIGTMTKRLLDVAHEYDYTDLPFVVAAMKISAQSLSLIMDESGRELAEKISSRTECIAVDLNEMKKQMEEGGNEKVDD